MFFWDEAVTVPHAKKTIDHADYNEISARNKLIMQNFCARNTGFMKESCSFNGMANLRLKSSLVHMVFQTGNEVD